MESALGMLLPGFRLCFASYGSELDSQPVHISAWFCRRLEQARIALFEDSVMRPKNDMTLRCTAQAEIQNKQPF